MKCGKRKTKKLILIECVLVYSQYITPRLKYILQTLFGKDVLQTENKIEFTNYTGVRINYSAAPITAAELWIKPHVLLFEKNIQPQNIECFEWNDCKVFFKSDAEIPFDIFAASFYLLSRYEEYLPHEKDEYGRYAHINSLAFKEKFLHLPLVNLWLMELNKILQLKFSLSAVHNSQFTFVPTYDIDIAYKYLHHSSLKKIGKIISLMMKGEWSEVKESVGVLRKKTNDSFDTYSWLDTLHKKYQLQPLYFFLLAEKRKGHDKNISPNNKAMQGLIQQHGSKYSMGIHPSWQSGDDENILHNEIELLKNISGSQVTVSRQHYIRMQFPFTYRLLIKYGITDDYSLGYGSINGFRASYTLPFYWYDLEKEEQTSLLLHPFCYMEANSFFEQHYTAGQASEELQQYFDTVKKVNGTLITIFHNHFVTEEPQWIEWRKMYESFLESNSGSTIQ